MLSSLPTELIREIIESTVPHSFHSTTYQERQNTLRSLSLVSKLFRSIAQPLLLEIVWIKSTSEIERLSIAGTSRIGKEGRGVQCAVIESRQAGDARPPSGKVASLERALRLLQSVTTLTVTGFFPESLDLCVFEDFTSASFIACVSQSKLIVRFFSIDLTNLHLSGNIWSCSRPPILPKIESLTLTRLSFETLEALVSRSTFPNLKEFALVDCESVYVGPLVRSGLRQLLPQLEAMSFDLTIWRDPRATFLHPAASRTLVDCAAYELHDLSI